MDLSMSYRTNDPDGLRTDAEFEANQCERTKRERLMMGVYQAQLDHDCPGMYRVTDNGVDNTGRHISDNEAWEKRIDFSGMDWKIVSGDKYKERNVVVYREAKVHSSKYPVSSFKMSGVREAIRRGGSILVLRNNHYLIIPAVSWDRILQQYPAFEGASPIDHKVRMGGKERVELWYWDIDAELKARSIIKIPWNTGALAVLGGVYGEVFPGE